MAMPVPPSCCSAIAAGGQARADPRPLLAPPAGNVADFVRETAERVMAAGDGWSAGRLVFDALAHFPERGRHDVCRIKREVDAAVAERLRRTRDDRSVMWRLVRNAVRDVRILSYLALGPRAHRWLYYRRPRPCQLPASRPAQAPASIVMLTYNRRAYVQQALAALHATTAHEENWELIVVDNGSTDGTQEMLRAQTGRGRIHKLVLRGANHGTSAGFNCGFAYARKDSAFLVRLDSDISILTPNWLSQFRSFLAANVHVGAVALYQPNHPVLRVAPVELGPGRMALIDWSHWCVGGGAMTFRRDVFAHVGYWREDFAFKYVPDDADYYRRLSLFGYKAYYLRDCRGYHHMEKDLGEYRAYHRGKRALTGANSLSAWSLILARFRKHPPPWEIAMAEHGEEYRRNGRAAKIHYPHYEDLEFPAGTNVLEIA